jgi:hypothetical protein
MKCVYCPHDDSKHCRGEVRHQNYKDEMRQVINSRTHVCHTRHCLEPMCDCVDLVLPSPKQELAALVDNQFGF